MRRLKSRTLMKKIYFTQVIFLLILSGFTFAQEKSDPVAPDEGSSEESATEQTTMPMEQYPDWLIGEWNALQVDTRIHLNLEESGKGQLKSTEGDNTDLTEIDWSVNEGIFIITIQEETLSLIIDKISDVGFRLFEQLSKSTNETFFYRAGIKARPSFLVGAWQTQDDNSKGLVLEADGNFTLNSEDSSLMGTWAQQDYELFLESTDKSSIIRYEIFSLTESSFVVKEQPSNTKIVFLKK